MYLSVAQLKQMFDRLPPKEWVLSGEVSEYYKFPVNEFFIPEEDLPEFKIVLSPSEYIDFIFNHKQGEWLFYHNLNQKTSPI